jgi:hypothetical protein
MEVIMVSHNNIFKSRYINTPALYLEGSFFSYRPASLTEVFCGYPQILQINAGIVSEIRCLPLPSMSILTCYLLIII